jgi:uncharacterized protein DUF4169
VLCIVLEHHITINSYAGLRMPCVATYFREVGTVMGDLVNLKRFKKRAAREQSAKQAEANRIQFGRTKAERSLDEQRTNRANDLLDQHLIDSKDAP